MTEQLYQLSPGNFVTLLQMQERLSGMELETAFHEWLSLPQPLRLELRAHLKERMANEAGITLK